MQELDETRPAPAVRGMGRRGMSPTMAAVILIVVIVIVGGAGYAGLNSIGGQGKKTVSTCTPSTAPACGGTGKLNDVQLFVAYQAGAGQTTIQLNLGALLPASVSLGGGESASSFAVSWGDGTNSTSTAATFTHTYTGIGLFVVSATAVVSGVTHTGTKYLFPVSVVPTLQQVSTGDFPVLATTITNGSAAPNNYYPWISQGGQVTVVGSYSTLPTAPGYTASAPSLVAPTGATLVGSVVSGPTSVKATYTFANPGSYLIKMVVPVTNGAATTYQNYTWNVYVGATGALLGCTNCRSSGTQGGSPHPGNLYVYEIVPGGATSLDPAVDYETTGGEIIDNVFETLIQYNATSTATYDPVLSTCIPGPAASGPTSCQSQYGSDLNGPLSGTGPNGTYWTFPIDPNASFYDPSTNAHWAVYPSDVMFSVARTLMWLENPSQYTTNGWIIGQSLLPFGTKSWDSGLHAPWNNTPQTVLTSMLVNDSAYCPAKALAQAGCITFKADGSGQNWSFFLEFVQDGEGASVVPCGWYTAQGAGLPGFTTNAAHGDGPCTLPGGTTSTTQAAFTSYVTSADPKLYDSIIGLDTINYQNPYPQVRWSIVGSGPYWLQSVNQGQGYILKANPYYVQPNCAGLPGCYRAPGQYAGTVYVFWDPNDITGVEQYIAGQSDLSTFFPSDIPTILNLVKQGKVTLFSIPTLNLFPEGFNFAFVPSAVQSASGLTTNVPGDFFAYPGMREFFAQTFPYYSFINVDNLVDGIPFIQGEGGAIPQYLGNYYAENITWPGMNASAPQWPQVWNDPSTTAPAAYTGSPAWWWANITDPSSPIYDPEAANCVTHPGCTFPIGSEAGAVPFDYAVDQWISIIKTVTHGAIVPTRWDPTFTYIVTQLGDPPGTNPMPTFVSGWLPDYPDPTDYMAPFWFPDGSYTYSPAYAEVMEGYGGFPTTYDCADHATLNFADMAYWANYPGTVIPTLCQGTAYSLLVWGATVASSLPVGPERVLYYNMVSHIGDKLALFVYVEQQVGVGSFASWINPNSFWYNVMAPGQLWFQYYGNNVA